MSLEMGMATHSNILAWRIPRTEEPGGLQSTGSQRVGHDWATSITMNVLFPVRFFFWESEFTDANLGYSSNELGYKDGISGLSVCESKNIKGLPESPLPLFFLRLESVWPFSRKAQHDPVTNLWRQEPRAHSVLILYHLQWGLRPLRVPSPLLSTWCHCS